MILASMCMCVVAVEMACLPDFFDHVSAKEHIAELESDLTLRTSHLRPCFDDRVIISVPIGSALELFLRGTNIYLTTVVEALNTQVLMNALVSKIAVEPWII